MTFRDDSLKELVDLCNDAQEKKAHLQSLVDNLEAKLERGECSPDLKAGLMEEEDESGKTLLEHYRDLLQYDVAAMGQAMQQYDEPQIQQVIDQLENITYHGVSATGNPVNISLDYLKVLDNQGYSISLLLDSRTMVGDAEVADLLGDAASVNDYRLTLGSEFRPFQDDAFQATQNGQFYAVLQSYYSSDGDSGKQDTLQGGLEDLMGQIQSKFTTFFGV